MGWSVEQVRRMRSELQDSSPAKSTANKKEEKQQTGMQQTTATAATVRTGVTTPAAAGTGWTPAQVSQMRTQLTAPTKTASTVSAADIGKKVLAEMTGTATGSPVKTDRQEDYEPDWNYVGGDSTPKQRAIAQGTYGSYAKKAQQLQKSFAEQKQEDDFDAARFDQLNQWMDADPRHRELVDLVRQKKQNYTNYAQEGTSAPAVTASTGSGAYTSYAQSGTSRSMGKATETGAKYTDANLLKKGYSQKEINEARAYLQDYNAMPLWQRAKTRTANTIGGIADTVASAPFLAGEQAVQSAKDIAATWKNDAALNKSLAGDDRAKELKDLMTAVDMDYRPQYTDADLVGMGYSQAEVDAMRAKLGSVEATTSVDKDTSVGYQLYKRGQDLTAAAQSGLRDDTRTLMGIATSAGENLAVAAINPAAVLPILSAQGGAEAMGQSMEKGESAGKTLAGGLAKFGAGWAINSVGAADLARTMGSDYAKDTVAGQIADWVRGLGGDSEFAKTYPAIANAVSGGIDNAMQAFVETYADTAIDALLLGDEEQAEALLKPETFLTALQSGLTGGASGALGGAIGTGLAKFNDGNASWLGQAEQADYEVRAAKYRQALAQQAAEQERLAKRALEPGESSAQEAGDQQTVQQMAEPAAQSPAQDAAANDRQVGNAAWAAEEQTQAQTEPASTASEITTTPAVKSDNAAVQQFARVVQDGQLTGKTIGLFTPGAANAANRAAFAEAYGVELPDTAAATRRALREIAANPLRQEAAVSDTNIRSTAEVETAETVPETRQAAVESAGETVETPSPLQSGDAEAATELPQRGSLSQRNEMRKTYGLRQQSLTEKQRSVQQELTSWKVSEGASQTISRMVPDSIAYGDLGRYTAAASSLYRLGQMEDVKTFDKALELAGSAENLELNRNYVLQQPGGREALQAAWLQGHGEVEAGNVERGTLGGALGSESTSGRGDVIWKNSQRGVDEMATQLIQLNAKGTGTDAILKSVLQGPDGVPSERVKAYIETETARIFFGDRNNDVFGTILHEDYHWYNALDQEGAAAVQSQMLEYLARNQGFEDVDAMINQKVRDYAAQNLTYYEAAEELVADSLRGIFETAEDMTRWAMFQREQADRNAGKAGMITKAVNAVKEMLNGMISRAKEVLTRDPENMAALKAARLAQEEKRALQDAYFAHAEKAMDNLRAAKKNAAALKTEDAAKGVRFEIKQDTAGETYIQIDEDLLKGVPRESWKTVVKQAIKERFPNGFVRNGWTILNHKDGRGEFVRSKYTGMLQRTNESVYADKMRMAANLDEIIAIADEVYREPAHHKNAEAFNRGKIKIRVGVNAYEVDVLTAIKPDTREIFYDIVNIEPTKIKPSGDTHAESEDSRSRLPKDFNQQESADTVLKTEEGDKRPSFPAETSITQDTAESKENNAPVKKTQRFQLEAPVEADGQKELVKLHTQQQQVAEAYRVLKEERSAWLNSAEVQKIETKKKALGNFSAEARAYRESAEYQDYLAKRKEYNSRLAALDEQESALRDQMEAVNKRLQQRQDASRKDEQLAYNARAEAYGGNAEYRRALAKEQFGTTEDFKKAGYILPDGVMLDFAQHDKSRDTDHREIMGVFGPAEVRNGTEALNEFLLDGNVRVMAEAPGIDISADTAPTAQQLEQIRNMVQTLGTEHRQFTLDISTADGRVAASKEYSGRMDADKVVREIQDYYKTGELAQESTFAKFRYQLAEQADREARASDQRQASRAIADKAAALDTLTQFFGLTRGVRVSQDSLDGLAVKWTRTNGSRADRVKLANEARVLVQYLAAEGADMAKAQGMAETLAGEVLDGATYRNSALWDEYPELHKLEYTVNKNGSAKAELVKRYGSWSEAVKEARQHGVTLRQADGVRDGNPAEQYESLVNDDRAVGGTRNGVRALWKAAAEKAGVAGAYSMESTEWLDVLMNVHDAIKPQMMSRFADEAEYEDARVELAGRMLGDMMSLDEMTDAEAIFEGIQKGQRQEFRRRLAENQRAAGQHTEVQTAKANARAEQQLNDILELQGVDITNMGDLNEKLTVLRETYEREMKQEVKRLKAERQEMLDEARLEVRQLRGENADLARQVKAEQRRADKAEYSLLVQENEILEWEAENERKREAWEQKQAQKNAIAQEAARQQRDEDIAVAKALAEKRVQKARDGRKADELKRSIRRNTAALNQMLLRPQKDKYVQESLIVNAAEAAKMADAAFLNEKTVNRLTALQDSINRSMGSKDAPNAMTEDWAQSKVPEMIGQLRDSLTASKEARLTKLRQQLAEAEALPDSEKAEMLRDRLKARIRETENRTSLPLNVEQLQLLKAITSSTLHVVRTANKTLSLAKAEEVDKIAAGAAGEVRASKGNHPGGRLDGVQNALTKYNLDMLGGERVFRMLGGYAKDGQMEKLARMLNDGQRRQTEITVEGEKLFASVTGKEHLKEMQAFAGPGAELVDVGLTDRKGETVPLTHAQLCSLYMHLQNADSREHLLTGGLTVPDAKLYSKGDIEQAYQKGQTVQLGMLKNQDGTPLADNILEAVKKKMTVYDRAWCGLMKDFFGRYTTNLINETSMQLLGYARAQVKNYYPIAVDKGALATQIEGLHLDATIEGRGFLKNRVKSSQPILLEECSSVVQRSLRDTAAYAGLALPIRDVQKVLNSNVDSGDGLQNLKNGIVKEQWGTAAVAYINDLLTDLQTTQRRRDNGVSRMAARLRGNYAGAILTLNPGVAIAQAASLPTAGAVLGMDTMAAVVPFVKNLSPAQRTALEAEITEHGDALLAWRKRGSQRGELASIGKDASLAEKAMDKLPKALTGWINSMDEITVAALWEGSKAYVKNHAAEFAADAAKEGSDAYWQAVNQTYQKVIEQTQPNYTVMQRAGIQRNPDEFVKTFTMFTTQRFQNYGILADAVGDYNAQRARYRADQSTENRAEVERAAKQLRRAAASQVMQTAVFALMKIGADFLLHRWDKEQDENGDVTLQSMLKRFTELFTESAAGNFLFGSEAYSLVSNAINGKDYDVVSATNISAVNDIASDVTRWVTEFRKDTSTMDEEDLEKHHEKFQQRTLALVEDGLEVAGVPFGNGKKMVDALRGYWNDIRNVAEGGKFSFNSLPESATGQYDRLYNAYAAGDPDEAQAAMEKLLAMGKEEDMYKQLKKRLVQYDAGVQAAAQAQVNGKDAEREKLTRQIVQQLYAAMGIRTGVKADAARREAVIDCVTGAVSSKADALLKGENSSVTGSLVEALDGGRADDVQEEIDRLLRAGKSRTTIKNKITETMKDAYLAGNEYDRERIEEMLLQLQDADGKAIYEAKNFAQWLSAAEKTADTDGPDYLADLR